MFNLPFTVRTMVRGGKPRKVVIQFYQWPDGRSRDVGRAICVSV